MSNWEVCLYNFVYRLAFKYLEIRPCDVVDINFTTFQLSKRAFPHLDLTQRQYVDDIVLEVRSFSLDKFDFEVYGDRSVHGIRVWQICSDGERLIMNLMDEAGNGWEIR